MTEPTVQMAACPTSQVDNPTAAAESQTKPTVQAETILQDILDTIQNSDVFPRAGKDVASNFWSTYERVAKQHDDEFLDRHNSDMDVLLIFAGLFSSVSSAFIVNMESNLNPNSSDTTNALLKVLINKVDNGTFSDQEAALPVWNGPSSTTIWIQTLAYTSLSMSLLAAFGAVLGKQWLGYFKISRFGRGALHERCKRRQQKLDGLEAWHFDTIIATLPIFLQLSLLFFGIALAANIWTQQHTVASVIMGATAFGVLFYFSTVVASLKSPDCPFQTPVSTILQHVGHIFRVRPASILSGLRRSLRDVLKWGTQLISKSIARLPVYFSRISSAPDDTESAGGSQPSPHPRELDLSDVVSRVELAHVHSILWILETSTDTDILAAAVRMVPEVEWPDEHDVTFVLDRLTSHFHACFDSTRQLTLLTRERALACLKTIYHFEFQQHMGHSITVWSSWIYSSDHSHYEVPPGQDLLLISCAAREPNELDMTSLTPSDRMWLAHMFTYRLHRGDSDSKFLTFVISFIDKCLQDPKTPSCLVADCWLLAGLMTGLLTNRRHLAKRDKSAAIPKLRRSVIDRILDVLLGGASISQPDVRRNARKLLQPLSYGVHRINAQKWPQWNHDASVRCLKLCFHFLEEPGTVGEEMRSKDVAAALHLSLFYSPLLVENRIWLYLCQHERRVGWYWNGQPDWHTQAQFDLLVDNHIRVCGGTDHTAIGNMFVVLAGLRGSPSTLERKRLYIQTMIQFMGLEVPLRTRHAAMNAAFAVRTEVASMGQDDESLLDLFSQALASVVLVRHPPTQQQDSTPLDSSPFNDRFAYSWSRDVRYLRLLSSLCQEPVWHNHLDRNGHFKNCLAIANTISSLGREFHAVYALHITRIFAIVDALGKEHRFLSTVRTYPIWKLILRAWRHIFHLESFDEVTWMALSGESYLEALQPLVAYARRYWKRWDHKKETLQLIELVAQVCDSREKETQPREKEAALLEDRNENNSTGNQGILDLVRQIRDLLRTWPGDI